MREKRARVGVVSDKYFSCGFDVLFPAGLCHPTRVGFITSEMCFPAQAKGCGPAPLGSPGSLSANGTSMFRGGRRASMPAMESGSWYFQDVDSQM